MSDIKSIDAIMFRRPAMKGSIVALAIGCALFVSSSGAAAAPEDGKAPPELQKALDQSDRDWDAACVDGGFAPYFRKTPCHVRDFTAAHFADDSMATADELASLDKVRRMNDNDTKTIAAAYRRHWGARGAELAQLAERVDRQTQANIDGLSLRKITWGEYNRTRKRIFDGLVSDFVAIDRKYAASKPAGKFPLIPMPKQQAYRDAGSCLTFVDDPAKDLRNNLRNDCGFEVVAFFCWLDAPGAYLDCDQQKSGVEKIGVGESFEVPVGAPPPASRRLTWVACERPGIPVTRWDGNRLVLSSCSR